MKIHVHFVFMYKKELNKNATFMSHFYSPFRWVSFNHLLQLTTIWSSAIFSPPTTAQLAGAVEYTDCITAEG